MVDVIVGCALASAAMVGCAASPPRPAAPTANISRDAAAPAPPGWRCFVSHPDTPVIEVGNVTHMKQRLSPDRYEAANVNVRDGVHRVTKLTVPRVGDVYQVDWEPGTLTLRLLDARGDHTSTHYVDPSGWEFTDEEVIDADGKTVTSTDLDASGAPVKTVVRFVSSPCDVVDAEIAKYPE